MGSLEIDLDLIERINQRFKIRTTALIILTVGLILEIAFIFYLIILQGLMLNSNFFPLSLVIFSLTLWFITYYSIFQIIDLREATESNYLGIKRRIYSKAKKRSKNFLIIFLTILVISIILLFPFNSSAVSEKSLHQGNVIYFANSYDFGARTIKGIGFNGDGIVAIYQNGSAVPVYQIYVNGNILLNQSLPPGYYEMIVQSGSINAYTFYESSYYPLIVSILPSLLGIIVIVLINTSISRNSKILG